MSKSPMKRAGACGVLMALLGISHVGIAEVPAPEPADTPVFDIPRLGRIVIDGKDDDWAGQGFCVETMASVDGKARPISDFDCRFRLGWDERGLLVLFHVRDDVFVESDAEDTLWQDDAVELFLADRRGGTQLVQAVIAPGMDRSHPDLRQHLYDHRKNAALQKVPPVVTAARTRTGDGYGMEVLLPWTNVGLTPRAGLEVGFQAIIDDVDTPGEPLFSAVWYPAASPFSDTRRTHRIRLSDSASRPVSATGRAFYDGMKYARAIVVAAPELTGKPVTVQADGRPISAGVLTDSGGRSTASLTVPLPAVGETWKTMQLLVDGQVIDSVGLPDVTALREEARQRLQYRFRPFCFMGDRLPAGDFENALEVDNVLGPYTVDVTYYDTAFKPVTVAGTPGRYGALVEIRPERGSAMKLYYTLCRLPAKIDWWRSKFPVTVEFPEALGISDAMLREQSEPVNDYVKKLMVDGFSRSPDSAVLMAGLLEARPGEPATRRTGVWARNTTWIHELKRRTGGIVPLQYLVHLPSASTNTPAAKLPAILYLHGSGGRLISLDELGNHEQILTYARTHTNFPFIVIVPQCPKDIGWQTPSLDDLCSEVMAKYPIDPDRFYLTGMSMGGYGSWMLVIEHPDRFAAVVPVCGGGDAQDVARIKDVPVWTFHGAKDDAVPIQRSNEMVEALRTIHGRVRYTVFPEGGHAIWNETYANPELYAWLLRQARGKPSEAPATVQGAGSSE